MGNCCRVCCITPEEESDDGNEVFLEKDGPEVTSSSDATAAGSSGYGALQNSQSPPPTSPPGRSDQGTGGYAFVPSDQQGEQERQESENSPERDADSGHESTPNDQTDDTKDPASPQAQVHAQDAVTERVITPPLRADPEEDTSEKSKLLADDASEGGDTEEQTFPVSVVVFGSTKVGKSCLVERMIWGERYNFEDETEPTLGMRVSRCEVHLPLSVTRNFTAPPFKVSIWDIPGKTTASTLRSTLRNKDAVCLVYDRTSVLSAEELVKNIPDVFKFAPGKVHVIIMANKADEFPHPELSVVADNLSQIVKKRGIREYDVSAKTGHSVGDVFYNLVYDTACKKFTERKLREAEALETEV